ncbi:hypothetical protein NDU88_008970 [Pleurodeles waltl]|uniref:Uncharacterized protein n=1 Tax=Pleurodeles waltl TaxID=8319 RepID=A0AAV7NZJ0_PLEWA|nr:hypothetical protein NDU88_008970 [Pleurodeles waltl]
MTAGRRSTAPKSDTKRPGLVLKAGIAVGKLRGSAPLQANKIDNYATLKEWQRGDKQRQATMCTKEPSLGAIMAAIRDLKSTLEPKVDVVMVDVALLCTNVQKVSDKMKTVETRIAYLQSTTKKLEAQVQTLTQQSIAMSSKLEDQEAQQHPCGGDPRRCRRP